MLWLIAGTVILVLLAGCVIPQQARHSNQQPAEIIPTSSSVAAAEENLVPQGTPAIPSVNGSPEPSGGSSPSVHTAKYWAGYMVTDSSGNERVVIVDDDYAGNYAVKPVFYDTSYGFYTSTMMEPEWIPYQEIESRYPVVGNMLKLGLYAIPSRNVTPGEEELTPPPWITHPYPYCEPSLSPSDRASYPCGIEQQLFALINQERAHLGIAPLAGDDLLSLLACDQSRDMALHGYFGHINTLGEDPTARAIRYGYSVYKKIGDGRYTADIGENIAQISIGEIRLSCPSEDLVVNDTPSGVADMMMEYWMDHDACQYDVNRKNILNPDFSHIGIGVVYDGSYYFATIDMG